MAAAGDEKPPQEGAMEAVVDLTGDSSDDGADVEVEVAEEDDAPVLLLPSSLKREKQEKLKAASAAAAGDVGGGGGSAEGGAGEASVIDLMDTDSDGEVQGLEAGAQEQREQTKQEEEEDWRAHPLVLVDAPEDNKGKGPARPVHRSSGASGSSGASQASRAAREFFVEISDSDDSDDDGRAAPGRRGAAARRTQGSRRAAPLGEGWDEGVEREGVERPEVRLVEGGGAAFRCTGSFCLAGLRAEGSGRGQERLSGMMGG